MLPGREQIRQAINLYLERAYPGGASPAAKGMQPPADCDLTQWLMSDSIERDPTDAPLEQVRSFGIRLGNELYPHMKVRLSRPPNSNDYVFTVDSHDAFLKAPAGSTEHEPLEMLKRHNASLADKIQAAWDENGLPTERNYLRRKIMQARGSKP